MARWRCLLCPAKGRTATHPQADNAAQQHYITTHMNKERT